MGGAGSGRPPSTETILARQREQRTPIGDDVFLPNYSGLKQEVKKGEVGDMLTAVDNGTYITIYTKGTALFRIEKATAQIQVQSGIDTDTTF